MSLNQFTLPNNYIPPVSFESITTSALTSDTINVTNINDLTGTSTRLKIESTESRALLPHSIVSDYTATPNNAVEFVVDGTNTAIILKQNAPGAGAYLQFEQPSTDNDFRIGVDPSSNITFSAKQPITIKDELFNLSLTLNKVPGLGLSISNPNIVNYTPSNLACYEEKTITAAMNGFTTPVNLIMRFTRIGNIVTALFSNVSASATGGIVELSANAITEPFRPTLGTNCSIPKTFSNAVPEVGNVEILPTGNLSFEYTPDVLFPVQPDSGWDAFSFSYLV